MGSGSYTASDWNKLRASRSITSGSSERELFRNQELLDKFNPRFIGVRESRDNDEHPNSTPIAIGLDVTGSMGYLPAEIIKNGLNELMKKLYASKVIPDPQLMFAACGDYCDDAPLQVTQFESDIRIAEQLDKLWFEFGGGGELLLLGIVDKIHVTAPTEVAHSGADILERSNDVFRGLKVDLLQLVSRFARCPGCNLHIVEPGFNCGESVFYRSHGEHARENAAQSLDSGSRLASKN